MDEQAIRTSDADSSRQRLLDPVDRISEVLFGLIMVLTFTCAFSVADAGPGDVRALLLAAIGCNIAWGLVDGVMFMTMGLVEHARGRRTLVAVQSADPERARALISDALPPVVAQSFTDTDFDVLQARLAQVHVPPRTGLTTTDWLSAVAVALLVFLSTFPVVVPFMFIDDPVGALRVSNVVAMAMLFACGHALGRYAGGRPWRTGLAMVVLGAVLVMVAIFLGG